MYIMPGFYSLLHGKKGLSLSSYKDTTADAKTKGSLNGPTRVLDSMSTSERKKKREKTSPQPATLASTPFHARAPHQRNFLDERQRLELERGRGGTDSLDLDPAQAGLP